MTEQTEQSELPHQAGDQRKIIWALVVGGLGVVVAVVALVIAISANSTTNDNAKITRAVRVEAARQIGGIRTDLQKNVVAATAVLRRLQHSSSKAHHEDATLRRDVNSAKNGVLRNGARINANRETIATLQTNIVHLQANVTDLQRTVGNLSATVKDLGTASTSQAQQLRALTRHLNALQKTVNNLP
jgi:chromosome segregation ATPase